MRALRKAISGKEPIPGFKRIGQQHILQPAYGVSQALAICAGRAGQRQQRPVFARKARPRQQFRIFGRVKYEIDFAHARYEHLIRRKSEIGIVANEQRRARLRQSPHHIVQIGLVRERPRVAEPFKRRALLTDAFRPCAKSAGDRLYEVAPIHCLFRLRRGLGRFCAEGHLVVPAIDVARIALEHLGQAAFQRGNRRWIRAQMERKRTVLPHKAQADYRKSPAHGTVPDLEIQSILPHRLQPLEHLGACKYRFRNHRRRRVFQIQQAYRMALGDFRQALQYRLPGRIARAHAIGARDAPDQFRGQQADAPVHDRVKRHAWNLIRFGHSRKKLLGIALGKMKHGFYHIAAFPRRFPAGKIALVGRIVVQQRALFERIPPLTHRKQRAVLQALHHFPIGARLSVARVHTLSVYADIERLYILVTQPDPAARHARNRKYIVLLEQKYVALCQHFAGIEHRLKRGQRLVSLFSSDLIHACVLHIPSVRPESARATHRDTSRTSQCPCA